MFLGTCWPLGTSGGPHIHSQMILNSYAKAIYFFAVGRSHIHFPENDLQVRAVLQPARQTACGRGGSTRFPPLDRRATAEPADHEGLEENLSVGALELRFGFRDFLCICIRPFAPNQRDRFLLRFLCPSHVFSGTCLATSTKRFSASAYSN